MQESLFFGGTSGLIVPMPRRDFPVEFAALSRLSFYGLRENSIEINSSFYKLPRQPTIHRWVTEVPAGFRFTFKLWQEITHQKGLLFNADNLHQFMRAIELAEGNKGCLLIQFPPSLQVSALPQLAELLFLLLAYDWRIAVEFRHVSWYNDSVYDLLNTNGIAMVLHDMPKSLTPMELTADNFVYLRFHGPSGNYKGSYTDAFLSEYASYIRDWQEEKKTVYCYFNNTAGDALQNLSFLKRRLNEN